MKGYLVLVGVAAVAAANAQVIWDDTALMQGTTSRGQGDEPALQIQNTNGYAVNLTSVFFQGQNNATQDIQFFLADSSGNVLQSTIANEGATGAHSLIGTNVNWTLAAGATYFIGAATSTTGDNYDYDVTYLTQNGLSGQPNGNFSGYGSLTFDGTAGAEMTWQLHGSAVPEPATLVALGLGAAGFLIRRRKK